MNDNEIIERLRDHDKILRDHEEDLVELRASHGKLFDAQEKLKEEQIRLREHMSSRFDENDRNITRVRNDLQRDMGTVREGLENAIKQVDERAEARNTELKKDFGDKLKSFGDDMKSTLSGLAASNPVWVTFVVTIVIAGLAILVTYKSVKG